MGHRAQFGVTIVMAGLAAAACSPQSTPSQTAAAQTALECVPLEEGAFYTVANGKLTAAQPPEPVIIERVVEPEFSWYERIEASLPGLGFPWMNLDASNLEAGMILLSGTAPSAEAKADALEAGESAIRSMAPDSDILVIDSINVEGGEVAVGNALAGLNSGSSVIECQTAFTRVMEGRNVSFATAGTSINLESGRLLDAASGVAKLCQRYEIEIGGHTDSRGDALRNDSLSELRAQAVRQYLIDRGVPAESLVAMGYGESQPLDTRDTEEAFARNRRTEFTVRDRR